MTELLLLLSLILFAGCSAATATAVCVPGISWMCTAAESACHQTRDTNACALAHAQETAAWGMAAEGMGQLGQGMGQLSTSMHNAASVAQTQRDVEAYKLANPTPPPLPSPPLIAMQPPQPVYLGPNPNGPGVLDKAPDQTPIIMLP